MARVASVALAGLLLALVLATAALAQSPAASGPVSPPPSPTPSHGAVSDARPEGTWTVAGYDLVGDGLVTPRRGTRLTVSFLPAGRLEGETACGTYVGGYSVAGETLSLGIVGVGNRPCRGRREEEAVAFTQALSLGTRWLPTEEGLDILDEAGRRRVALVRDDATIIEGDWRITQLARGRIGPRPVRASPAMSMSFAATGEVAGGTGCRGLASRYEVQAAVLLIAPLTLLGLPCDGVAGRLERRLLAGLDRVASWRRDGSTLRLLDGRGQVVLVAEAIQPAPPASPIPTAATVPTGPTASPTG